VKTEELKQIGLSDEQIKEVFKLNGADVNAAKESAKAEAKPQIDNLNSQLQTATESLKKFEGIDPAKLQTEIQNLNTQLATQKADYEKQIADRDFNSLLDSTIASLGGKNAKAIGALLTDVEKIRGSKNQEADLKAALETIKKENDYLFESAEPFKNPTGRTSDPAGGNGGISEAAIEKARAIMGLTRPAEKK